MPAAITTVADAVVDALNEATFSDPHPGVYAQRRYRSDTQLKELGEKVHVIVRQTAWKAVTVDSNYRKQRDCLINLGIQRRINFAENEDGDALMLLVQEIETLFLGKALAGVTECACVASDPEFSDEQLQTAETFACTLGLTFRVVG